MLFLKKKIHQAFLFFVPSARPENALNHCIDICEEKSIKSINRIKKDVLTIIYHGVKRMNKGKLPIWKIVSNQ